MGREHFSEDENNEYSVEYCVYCEIKCIHRNCMLFEDFTCIECTYVILSRKTAPHSIPGMKITDMSSTTKANTTNSTKFDYSMDEKLSSSSSSFLNFSTSSAYTWDCIDNTNNNNDNSNNSENVIDKIHPAKAKKSNRRKKLIRKINYDFKEAKISINIEFCDFTKVSEITDTNRGTLRPSACLDSEQNSPKKRKVTG